MFVRDLYVNRKYRELQRETGLNGDIWIIMIHIVEFNLLRIFDIVIVLLLLFCNNM